MWKKDKTWFFIRCIHGVCQVGRRKGLWQKTFTNNNRQKMKTQKLASHKRALLKKRTHGFWIYIDNISKCPIPTGEEHHTTPPLYPILHTQWHVLSFRWVVVDLTDHNRSTVMAEIFQKWRGQHMFGLTFWKRRGWK